jgi:hypothetical protein
LLLIALPLSVLEAFIASWIIDRLSTKEVSAV